MSEFNRNRNQRTLFFLSFIKLLISFNIQREAAVLLNENESENGVHRAFEKSSCITKYANKTNCNIDTRKIHQHPIKQQTTTGISMKKLRSEVILLWRKTDTILCREIDNKCKERKKENFLKSIRVSHIFEVHPWWISWQQFHRCLVLKNNLIRVIRDFLRMQRHTFYHESLTEIWIFFNWDSCRPKAEDNARFEWFSDKRKVKALLFN